eukprot:366233-Chlamydomonas_euryale.AAC.5
MMTLREIAPLAVPSSSVNFAPTAPARLNDAAAVLADASAACGAPVLPGPGPGPPPPGSTTSESASSTCVARRIGAWTRSLCKVRTTKVLSERATRPCACTSSPPPGKRAPQARNMHPHLHLLHHRRKAAAGCHELLEGALLGHVATSHEQHLVRSLQHKTWFGLEAPASCQAFYEGGGPWRLQAKNKRVEGRASVGAVSGVLGAGWSGIGAAVEGSVGGWLERTWGPGVSEG